ncbi:MAG: hypothetical protein M1830_002580 [Pleopsidium flavum]|nr:MAG: hypothetical protein M1830_002580 [Pleopsidium flavum]
MYQPPNATASATEEKKGFLGGAMSEIKGMKNEAIKSMQKIVGSSSESNGGRKRTAAELKRATAATEEGRETAKMKWEEAATEPVKSIKKRKS